MNKKNCEYCKGITYDDTRGHCIACGAPRKNDNAEIRSVKPSHLYIQSCADSAGTVVMYEDNKGMFPHWITKYIKVTNINA